MVHRCPTCGSVPPPKDAGWRETEQRRIVDDGEELVTTGVIPTGGMFPRLESVSLTTRAVRRWRIERMWVRQWAESEWRAES